jgi:hypothetical protein
MYKVEKDEKKGFYKKYLDFNKDREVKMTFVTFIKFKMEC